MYHHRTLKLYHYQDVDYLIACVPEPAFDDVKGEHEGADEDDGLNSDNDVEGDDCFFMEGYGVCMNFWLMLLYQP